MRLKRSAYNLFVGIFSQIIILGLGLVIPRLFLVNFGSETNGLISSVNDIFVYIALLEAGVGAATVQALYKPVFDDDKNRINEILSATAVYYRRTGIIYFAVLILFSLVYPFVAQSSIDYMTIALVVFFTGIGNVINFFFQGKYKQLLLAEGKAYITTGISSISAILANVAKIVLLLLGFDVVAVQFVFFVLSLLQMIVFEVYIKTKYKWLNVKAKPDFKALSQNNSVLVHQISGLVFKNTDVILLSVVYGLATASVYVMYNIIFNVLEGFVNTINDSFSAALGQEYNSNKDGYKKLYNYYELGYLMLAFILCSVVYVILIPFIKLYTSGVNDISYIVDYLPIAFVAMKFLNWGRMPSAFTITFAGKFKETRFKAIMEVVINLSVSIILIKPLGICGVVIGSAAAYLYSAVYSIWYANKYLVDLNYKRSILRWILFVVAFAVFAFVSSFITVAIDGYLKLFLLAAVTGVVAVVYYGAICFVFNRKDCVNLVKTAVSFVKAKIGK